MAARSGSGMRSVENSTIRGLISVIGQTKQLKANPPTAPSNTSLIPAQRPLRVPRSEDKLTGSEQTVGWITFGRPAPGNGRCCPRLAVVTDGVDASNANQRGTG